MASILIDTNVLVYAHDPNEPARQEQALRTLGRLEETAAGQLSVQCLAEFFSIATHKLQPPLTPREALMQIELLSEAFPVLDLTTAIVLEAARGVRDHQLSYYDAQLWATAKLYQLPIIFSQDFASGSVLEGVRFTNPFAPEFVLDAWA